jgi:hypothetical protein
LRERDSRAARLIPRGRQTPRLTQQEEIMTRIGLKKATRAAMACTAFTFILAGAANANESYRIEEMDFTVQNDFNPVVNVVSTDNERWDRIEAGEVKFGAHVMARAKSWTDVRRVGLILGQCGGTDCNGKPRLWSRMPWGREYENQFTVTFPTSQIPVSSSAGIASVPLGDDIVRRCNASLPPSGGASEHSFNYLIPATFVVDTTMDRAETTSTGETTDPKWVGDVDGAVTRSFLIRVVCKPFERKRAVDGVAAEQPKELKVGDIELFQSTYVGNGNSTRPNAATVCKKGRLLVRLTTNKAGPVQFRLWTKIGDAPMTDKLIDAWASHAGPGKYQAEYDEWVAVNKTTYVQAMAEDRTNAIGQNTGWKDITLTCSDVSGGGYADVPNTNNPDDGTGVAPLKVTGELTLADGGPKDRPRLGQAVFKIWTNKPGATKWKLTCSGGRNWEGTLPTFKIGDHKYQAVGHTNFQISKTEQIGCALRSLSLPNRDVIAVASGLFELIKRNPKVDPVVGETNPSDPTHTPRVPGFKVAPPPKLVCIGGKAAGVTCACPPRTDRVQFGPHSYRCQVNVVAPRPTFEGPREDFRRPGFVGPRPGFNRPFARPLGPPMHGAAIGPRRFFR